MVAHVILAMTLVGYLLAPRFGSGQESEEPRSSIAGIVMEQASGEPIRNAEVGVRLPGGYRSFRTLTDARGRFLLRNLEAGEYLIQVRHRGYLGPRLQQRTAVGEAESVGDLRIELRKPGVISGRVLDEYGEPMINARVETSRLGGFDGKQTFVSGGSADTDDRGQFRVANLWPGRYAVSASYGPGDFGNVEWQPALDDPEGERLSMAYLRTYYPGSLDAANAILVDVSSGQEVGGIEIPMEPHGTLSISGRITGIPHGGTRTAPPSLRSLGDALNERYSPSLIDHLGNFSFRGIPPGHYLLTAYFDQSSAGKRIGWMNLHLTDRSLSGLILELKQGSAVEGVVVWEGIEEGDDYDSTVLLHPVDAPDIQRDGSANSDTGRFRIEAVPSARYTVEATGYERGGRKRPYFLSELRVGGAPQQEMTLTVGESPPPELEVIMAPSARIFGVVLDESGNPAPGAIVLLASDEDDWAFSGPNAVTDQRGGFAMEGYVPGERILYALDRLDPDADDPETLKRLLQGQGTKLKVEKAGNHQVKLTLVEREQR